MWSQLTAQYGLFFASAGHAALIDYPHAKGLHKIASDIWNAGGVAAAVYVFHAMCFAC